eukprot:262902-Alexandrium_andersonii.AAC.1
MTERSTSRMQTVLPSQQTRPAALSEATARSPATSTGSKVLSGGGGATFCFFVCGPLFFFCLGAMAFVASGGVSTGA